MPRRREPRASELTEVKLVVPGDRSMVDLLGQQDELLKVVEAQFDSSIIVRGNEITITGEPHETEVVGTLFAELLKLLAAGQDLTKHHVGQAIDMVRASGPSPSHVLGDTLLVHRGKAIRPKTAGQKRYVDAIRKHTVTFAIGPAGTGKTYLAMAMAVAALAERDVSRIILTRPAVEAGEKLGYLPGTLFEKVDPYLRPLYDALFDMMDPDAFQRHMDRGTIEVAPLAFMRGRTLNDSFIILDEAQNTSPEQMKMFLTRLGFGSKAVVTGDVTQIDLPTDTASGLKLVQEILSDISGIAFCHLVAKDVVRHELVQRIVEAYKVYDDSQGRPG
jgi:phosphate starvation-inducible PhoH-like protein